MFVRIVLVMGLLAFVISQLDAQEEKVKEIKGTIRSLDLKTGLIDLQLLYSDKHQAFSLGSKELPVFDALGRPAKLAELRSELRISAKVRGEDEIIGVRVDGPHLNGMVKKVDIPARTLIVKDPFADKVITIPANAKIMSLGADYPFTKLKAGDPIQITYAIDGKTILKVQTGKGTNIRDPLLRMIRYYGIIADLDKSKSQVTMMMQSIDAGTLKTYPISPNAYLRMMYQTKPVKEIPLEQLGKWVKASFCLNRDTGALMNIDADLPVMLRRKVVKFDLEAMTLVVEDELKEKTLRLAPDVQVLAPKGQKRLTDVAPGRIVNCALTLDREQVQVLYLWDR